LRVARRGGETTLHGRLPSAVRVVRVESWDEASGSGRVIVSCEHPVEALVLLDGGAKLCAVCGSRGRELPAVRAAVVWEPG
jgi:hypothetical protein